MKIAIIGTYPPRQCGIATFTNDLYQSIATQIKGTVGIIAITNNSETLFPDEVLYTIDQNDITTYHQAADFINGHFDILIIQHEYGIFGGISGSYIVEMVECLTIPFVCNFHTVLKHPSSIEKTILQLLANKSTSITVMTHTAVDMLKSIYRIDDRKISLIPHGVPKFTLSQQQAKQKLNLTNKKIMLSFGFLGPSKGFETAIKAVSLVNVPDFEYIILGTTHPNILKESGETYRELLEKMTKSLNISNKVHFINEFATEEVLTHYLSACDIYVTPYPNESQISSGTLSFAIGAGAAVLSTPYWYAKDLLKNQRGLLFPFNDSDTLAKLIQSLLTNKDLLNKYRHNAYQYGLALSWKNIGQQHINLLSKILLTKHMYRPSYINELLPQKDPAYLLHTSINSSHRNVAR